MPTTKAEMGAVEVSSVKAMKGVLPRGVSTGAVSAVSVVIIVTTALLRQDGCDLKHRSPTEVDFIYEYYLTAIIICFLLAIEIFNQMPFLQDFYIIVQVVAVLSLLWPNIMFISVPWATYSTFLVNAVIRSRGIVRYWCVTNVLSHLEGCVWRQATVVARVCYANILFALLQVQPNFIGEYTTYFNMVYYVILWAYVMYFCGAYFYKCLVAEPTDEEKRRDSAMPENSIEKQGQLSIEKLLSRGFAALLVFSTTFSLLEEAAIASLGERAMQEVLLGIIHTCEIFVTTAICSSLVRSELRGAEDNQKTLLSRITLLRGFSSVFRAPFSNIFQGLKLLSKDLEWNRDTYKRQTTAEKNKNAFPDEWEETVRNVLSSWRNTLDIFDDMLICEIFEDKAIKLDPTKTPVLSFVQDAAKQLRSQAQEENITLNVLGGPLAELDFEFVQFSVDAQKFSSALRAIISNVISSSPKNTEVWVTVWKVFNGPPEPFGENTGLERVRIEIQNKKMDAESYAVGENSLFGASAHFTAATDNDTGLGLWIASSTIREHPNGTIGLERKVHPSNRKYASFVFFVELPAFSKEIAIHEPSMTMSFQSIRAETLEERADNLDVAALQTSLMKLSDFRDKDGDIVGRVSLEPSPDNGAELDSESTPQPPRSPTIDYPHVTLPPILGGSVADAASVPKFRRILIVDDAEMAVKMTVRILKNMSLASDYMSTTSGSDAIQIVTASMGDPDAKIDAIFLDYVMPVVNGPTVAATIRQLGYTGVIIGVTALTEADAKDVFLGNGADVVTEKPLRPHAVEMALSTVVARMGSGKSDTPHK